MSNEVQVKKLTDIMAQFVGFTAKKLPDDVIARPCSATRNWH